MNRRAAIFGLMLAAALPAAAQDPGKDVIGSVRVKVYFGTNGDPATAGPKAEKVEDPVREALRAQESLRFDHYRLLGTDTKPVFRSYENWAQPIGGSEEILCRFEVQSRLSAEAIRLDLELWLSRKKILKTGAVVATGRPVLVLGPEWRGGRMIVAVELAPPEERP